MQRPSYVLCRLKEKAKDKANTPYCGEGKSIGDIMSEIENPVTPAAIPWPNSPACNLTDEEISLPRSVGRFLYELQSSYGEPEARRKEIVNSRGDTNTEGIKEQKKIHGMFSRELGIPLEEQGAFGFSFLYRLKAKKSSGRVKHLLD
ncbi:hypothetical protein L484_019596 [Morus notabilis]|uniref:Uncharacterized protein n=1 Tax=Morus notabilis TaxID=981085 RepID=W9RW10_9ROSA|nr:hypothetical protein L484_019596 [Morus notabilis]